MSHNDVVELTGKQHAALELLATGAYTQKEAADRVSVSLRTVGRWAALPAFRVALTERRKELYAVYAPKALHKLVALLDSESDAVALAAAKDILDRAGDKPPVTAEVTETVSYNPFHDLTADELRALANLPGQGTVTGRKALAGADVPKPVRV